MAQTSKSSRLFFPAVILIMLAGWKLWDLYLAWRFPVTNGVSSAAAMAMRGQYGDQFGGVNALFQAIVLAGLLYGIRLQRNEMDQQTERHQGARDLQRKEIEQLAEQQRQSEERAERIERRSEDDHRRTAILLALSTQAIARTGLLAHRREFHRQSQMILATEGYPDEQRKQTAAAAHANLEATTRDLTDLEATIVGLRDTIQKLNVRADGSTSLL